MWGESYRVRNQWARTFDAVEKIAASTDHEGVSSQGGGGAMSVPARGRSFFYRYLDDSLHNLSPRFHSRYYALGLASVLDVVKIYVVALSL